MPRKNVIETMTERVNGLANLVLLALGGTLALLAACMVGNLLLYTLSHITDTLFDLINNIFRG